MLPSSLFALFVWNGNVVAFVIDVNHRPRGWNQGSYSVIQCALNLDTRVECKESVK